MTGLSNTDNKHSDDNHDHNGDTGPGADPVVPALDHALPDDVLPHLQYSTVQYSTVQRSPTCRARDVS